MKFGAYYFVILWLSCSLFRWFIFFTIEQDDDARQDFNLQTCDDVSENPPTDEDTDVIYMPEDRPSDRLSRPRSSIGVESIRNSASFRSWLTSMATLPEKMIRETCGKDALFYLRFQRHIIFFLFIVMIMSICVILPINLQGKFTYYI